MTRFRLNSTLSAMAIALAALLMMVAAAKAQNLSGSANNSTLTNYSGILVKQANGTYGTLPVQAGYRLTNNSGTFVNQTFRMGFKVVNGTGITVVSEVFTNTFSVALFEDSSSGTQTATITPLANSLPPGTSYQIVAHLYRQTTPGNFVAFGFAASSDPYRFDIVNAGANAGVVGTIIANNLTQSYAVATVVGGNSFQVAVDGAVGRLEQFGQPVTSANYQIYLDVAITGDASGDIPLTNSRTTIPAVLANHTASGGASGVTISQTLNLTPAAQMDSTDNFTVTVKLSYAGPNNLEMLADTNTLTAQRLLHFNGTLLFGTTAAQINAVANSPEPLGTVAGVGENTTLGIFDEGASLNSNPAYTFGTGDDLSVLLHLDGTAEVTAGGVTFTAPNFPDSGTVNGVGFNRDVLMLDATGAFAATINVQFPAGFGVGIGNGTRRLLAAYPAGTLALDAALNPTGTVSLDPGSVGEESFYAVHEELPEVFQASGIVWDIAAGTFTVLRTSTTHVRAAEMSTLNNANLRASLADPAAADRPSNDGYLLNPAADGGVDVVIGTDPQGRAVLTTAQIDLPASNYTAHFPLGTNVTWTLPGVVVVQDGFIDTTQSILPGASNVAFTTSPGAPSNPSPVGLDSFNFSSNGAAWVFTPDGGLRAEGTITAAPLRWGARDAIHFANYTGSFAAADAHLPGHVLRGALATTVDDNRPGELLFSGQGRPGDPTYIERPGEASYRDGFADYAGLNFRVASDGAQTATSLIGDASVGPYPLQSTCKYYARPAGVSGIHEAVTSVFASQAGALILHGFPLSLNNFQLSFLDNNMRDSLISGTITVPGALGTAGFAQPFSQLKLTSKGEPSEVVLPEPNNYEHTLTYWNAKFHPLAVEFQPHPTNANLYALVFGAEVLLEGVVKDPIRGALGFFPNGRMVAAADGFPGLDSRLKPPKLIGLHGTGSLLDATRPAFSVHPVSDIYFNNPGFFDSPSTGFVSFAGTVAVPFFEDLKVHVLARANGSQTTVRSGWSDATGDFFTNAKFDATNHGFPSGGLAAYENPAGADNPHAKQSWMGFINFDMPVVWDAAQRQFASSTPETQDFLVLNSERVITQLAPSGASIRFGLQFNGLPRLDLASLVIDEDEATNKVIGLIPNGAKLVAALKAFDLLLSGNSDQLISDAANAAIGDFIDQQLFAKLSGDASAKNVRDQIAALNMELTTALGGIVGNTSQDANTLLKTMGDALHTVDDGLGTADALLTVNPMTGRFQIFETMKAIGRSLNSIDPADGMAFDEAIDGLAGEITPTLLEIKNAVDALHNDVSAARGAVDTLHAVLQTAASGQIVSDTLTRMQEVIPTNDPTMRYFAEIDRAKLKTQLELAARSVLTESGFISNLQSTVRDLVEPLHEEYRGVSDQIHGVINDGVRSAFSKLGNEVASHINENLANANRAIGAFNDTFRLSKTEGTARIIGNVLDNAHINAALSLHVPDPVTLTGSIDFQHLRGDQPVPGVAGAGADGRMQITVKAEGNASIAGCPPVDARAVGQYTMNSGGHPLGVSGSLTVDSDVHFDILALKHAEFDFAFGALDNYLYADASGSILIFDAQVKGFLGRTTQDAVLRKVDPLLDQVLTAKTINLPQVSQGNPITGFYFNAIGDVVLNRLLGIPDDVITLKGRGGQGRFAFVALDHDFPNDLSKAHVIPGMRWDSGFSVSFGPVTAGGELVALGGLNPLALFQTDNVADIAATLFTPPVGIDGALAVKFTASAGPFSQDFKFTATGKYTPPPFAPPPGFFFVNSLDF